MLNRTSLLSLVLLASLHTAALAQGSAVLRVSCTDANAHAEIHINGEPKGNCPVDIPVPPGAIELRALKKIDAVHERVFELDFQMFANTAKRVEVELGAPRINPQALRRQQAEAARVAAEAQRQADERLAATVQRAEAGDANTMAQLGWNHLWGHGVPVDFARAQAWFQRAADAGNSDGMAGLGAMHHSADGVKGDPVTGRAWLQKAADLNHPRALQALADIEAQTSTGTAEWPRIYDRALRAGDPGALAAVAAMLPLTEHARAEEFSRKAVAGFQALADAGDPDAMNRLAYAYQNGIGVAKDPVKASAWFARYRERTEQRLAAGSANAAFALAVMQLPSYQGAGAKDRAKAVALLRQAEGMGHPQARKLLDALSR